MSVSLFTCSVVVRLKYLYIRPIANAAFVKLPIFDAKRNNSTRLNIVKQKRSTYPRMYKTTIVLTDGSTVSVRLANPRKIIKMPLDVLKLSETERKNVWLSRTKKVEKLDDDEVEDNFDPLKYLSK
uniref:39S ribosomal protein L55, mitochondrial n=1 Tax=Ciona savignyi TaxID=51511 RepID=H2YZU3_CIOSA